MNNGATSPSIAMQNSIAERQSVEAARQQLKIVQAGFYPRVDLVANIGKNQSDTFDTIGQRYASKSVGIEVTIPLYSGGMVKASSEQANANYARMQFELQDKTDKVLLDVRKQYNLCVSSLTRIAALQSAVESATLLITATHKSVQAGLRTNVDVLSAEQQLYQAKRDLSRARYQYLLADLQLRHAAGILTAQDLYQMAQWFEPPPFCRSGRKAERYFDRIALDGRAGPRARTRPESRQVLARGSFSSCQRARTHPGQDGLIGIRCRPRPHA